MKKNTIELIEFLQEKSKIIDSIVDIDESSNHRLNRIYKEILLRKKEYIIIIIRVFNDSSDIITVLDIDTQEYPHYPNCHEIENFIDTNKDKKTNKVIQQGIHYFEKYEQYIKEYEKEFKDLLIKLKIE